MDKFLISIQKKSGISHFFFIHLIFINKQNVIMKKSYKYNLQETVKDIERLSKLLKESYVFDEEDMEEMPQDEIMDEEPIDEPCCADEKINQIRSLALEGIQEFAEQVDSEEYQIFKNIWMSCDKFYSNKNKEKEI